MIDITCNCLEEAGKLSPVVNDCEQLQGKYNATIILLD